MEVRKVTGNARMDFLYRALGQVFMQFESTVYSVADKFSDYDGGMWDFFELVDDGKVVGMYMAPSTEKMFMWNNPMNYSEGTISSDALGIISCLYAFSHLSFRHEAMGDFYHSLRELAYDHPESEMIFMAID